MEAIILAGGLGTRLASRLAGIPKPMAPVAGRPFLDHLLERLDRSGCSRVVLSVGHLSDVIRSHVGERFGGMTVAYVPEEFPLGTGGAIRKALTVVREPVVLVLNGDTFVPLNYAEMLEAHLASSADITMAISEQPDVARYGEVLVEGGRVQGFTEKGRSGPGWINAGVYALRSGLAWPSRLEEKFSFETDFLAKEIGRLHVRSFQAPETFIDIGIPEDLDRAQTLLGKGF